MDTNIAKIVLRAISTVLEDIIDSSQYLAVLEWFDIRLCLHL